MLEEIFRLKCLSVRQATITQNGQINHLKQVFVFKTRSLGCLDKWAAGANTALPNSNYVQCPIIATYSCHKEHPNKEDELL